MAWSVALFVFLLASGLGVMMIFQGVALWKAKGEGKAYIAGGLVLTTPLSLLILLYTYLMAFPIHWG